MLLDLMPMSFLWAAPSSARPSWVLRFLPPGICGMVAVSWYAFNITRDFFDPLYAGTK